MVAGSAPNKLRVKSRAYRQSLARGRSDIRAHIARRNLAFGDLRQSLPAWDALLEDFVKWAFANGVKRYRATLAVLAVQQVLRCSRQRLPGTWAYVWEWTALTPGKCRTPMPPALKEAFVAVAMGMAGKACDSSRRLWLAAALLWWLAFEALLRASEIYGLKKEHILLAADVGSDEEGWVVVVVTAPKNKRAMGLDQFILLEAGPLARMLSWWVAGLPDNAFLFTGSKDQFRTLFRGVATILGVQDLGLTNGSWRPGGATDFFRVSHGNVAALQFRGRWASLSSLGHYLQEATAAMTAARIPNEAKAGVRDARASFATLSRPPAMSCARFLGFKGANKGKFSSGSSSASWASAEGDF